MKFVYTVAMRYAAVALFVIGLLAAAGHVVIGLETMDAAGESLRSISQDSSYAGWMVAAYARFFVPALNALVWPWLGAAALWRFDGIFLRRHPAPPQEAAG